MSTNNLFNQIIPRFSPFTMWKKVCENEDRLLQLTLSASILMVLMATVLFETNVELTTGQTIFVAIGMVVEFACGIVAFCGFAELFSRKK